MSIQYFGLCSCLKTLSQKNKFAISKICKLTQKIEIQKFELVQFTHGLCCRYKNQGEWQRHHRYVSMVCSQKGNVSGFHGIRVSSENWRCDVMSRISEQHQR